MSNLPGKRIPSTGHMCETCEEAGVTVAATWRLTGETDSFGSEYIFLCSKHLEEYDDAASEADTSGRCDWCKIEKEKLVPHRDIDEGSNGPVYYVCRTCIQKESADLEEELDTSSDRDEDWDFPDDDPIQEEEEEELPVCDWPAGSEFKVTYRTKCWPMGYGDTFTKYFQKEEELAAWELDQAQWARLEGNDIQGSVLTWDVLRGDEFELRQL
jgi:hypothetical protein